MINFEGGAIAEEYQVEYVVDRVEATSTAFMGLTMGCARCHSHKFDPITHKEFYQFFAFFNTVPEHGLDGRTRQRRAVLPLPSPEQQAQLDELDAAIETHESRARPTRSSRRCSSEWEDVASPDSAGGASTATGWSRTTSSTATSRTSPAAISTAARSPAIRRSTAGRSAGRRRSTATPRSASATSARSIAAIRFSLAVWLKGRGNLPMTVFQKLDDAQHRRGYEWRLDDIALVGIQRWAARLTVTLASDRRRSAIQIRTRERLTPRRLVSRRADLRRLGQGGRPALYRERRAGATSRSCSDTLTGAVGDRRAAARRQQALWASRSSDSSTICASTTAC